MINFSIRKTFLLILLSILCAFIGVLIYFWGTPSTPESKAFVATPEFFTWFVINILLFAAYPILVLLLWQQMKQIGKNLHNNLLEIIGLSLMFLGLFIFPDILGRSTILIKPLPLDYVNIKIPVIEITGFLVSALPVSISIWLIQANIRDAFNSAEPTGLDINNYILFRNTLQMFLKILGALLSANVLASAALRVAAIMTGSTSASKYPMIYLLLLGAYETLLVAIIYFPAYLSLISAGRRILDVYFPMPVPGSEGWVAKYMERKQLEDLLELKVTGEQRFLAGITLLAPFVSGIFSALAGK